MRHILLPLALIIALPSISFGGPVSFSVDPASPATGVFSPNDVLAPGPGLLIPEAALGLGIFDNLNALSFGNDRVEGPALTGDVQFSVDRVSSGLPGTAVDSESFPGADAAADIFSSTPSVPGPGTNGLTADESSLGLTGGFFGDDIDALDLNGGTTPYLSFDALSAANGFGALTLANDIFLGSIATPFASGEAFGLDPFDDLDALILNDRGTIGVLDPGIDSAYFSLSFFSPSTFTFTGAPYLPGPHGAPAALGAVSPADVLYTDFLGPITLAASAPSIGLDPMDEVDAISNPEPGTFALVGIGVAGFIGIRRRRKRKQQVE